MWPNRSVSTERPFSRTSWGRAVGRRFRRSARLPTFSRRSPRRGWPCWHWRSAARPSTSTTIPAWSSALACLGTGPPRRSGMGMTGAAGCGSINLIRCTSPRTASCCVLPQKVESSGICSRRSFPSGPVRRCGRSTSALGSRCGHPAGAAPGRAGCARRTGCGAAATCPPEATEVLRRYGNMSSPSVLFVLEEILRREACPESLWLTSFGAGFSAHSCRAEQV